MNTSVSEFTTRPGVRSTRHRWWHVVARRIVWHTLEKLGEGELVIVEDGESQEFGDASRRPTLASTVEVHDPRAYREIVFRGSTGGGRAYMKGWWSSTDLPTLIRILIRNRGVLFGLEKGWAHLGQKAEALYHSLHRNTRGGSRRNMGAHYDLGNDFFSLFLDETLSYSCAIFDKEDMTLRQAAEAKYDLVCRKLELRPQDHLLEIGAGWGGLAIYAARHYGCRVTTTTISAKQYDFACKSIRAAGLSDRVRVLKEDYRSLTGVYDKLVSIEMIEAVGHQYYETYFRTCDRLLKPEGRMLLQAITAPDEDYEERSRSSDFIKRYIFPGSTIPSEGIIREVTSQKTKLNLIHTEDITAHYVSTLRIWRKNFLQNIDRAWEMGYTDRFTRMWDYYLAYCEGGFHERHIGDVQMLFSKPTPTFL
jgi:cyclopropane-fatty-acyl-phospholipid synthase